jgi:hypothetical protein
VAVFGGWEWYVAGVQQQVYARQGVQMSHWEIMLGARPVVRPLADPVQGTP